MFRVRDLVRNKLFIIGGLLVMVFLGVVEFKQLSERLEVQKEIDSLTKQADDLQKSNSDMQNLIAYLKTDSYKEEAAREQLKLKKDGEVVYSFAQPSPTQSPYDSTSAARQDGQGQSNPKKWWNYFFNPSL